MMTATIAEVGGSHHTLLILLHTCLRWKVVTSLMVEFEAGHYILFILPGVQEVKTEMKTAMEEV
eukprot:8358215-Ditylum_brightwellii.AAC.1